MQEKSFSNSPLTVFLAGLPLFQGIDIEQLPPLLEQLSPTLHSYTKDELLLLAGQENRCTFIVLEGEITAYRTTPGGHRVHIARMTAGGMFGDVLSGSSTVSPVTVAAHTDCRVLALPYERIIALCPQNAQAHSQLLRNLVAIISDKYFAMSSRVDVLILKSLRAKLCAWLLEQHKKSGSLMFSTGMTRLQLAEYLNCERSALSRELGRMQNEGLLKTHRDSFKLLDLPAIRSQYEGEFF